MALTTLQFWQQQLPIHRAAQTAALFDLVAAQALQKTVGVQLATDLKALADIGAVINAQRAQLAVVTVPAEANALVVKITAQVILQRSRQGKVLDDQAALDAASAAVDAASASQARAASQVAVVQAAIARATTEVRQRDALKAAIAKPPFVTLKADATALLVSTTASHAATRLAANFPAAILTLAGKRHAARSGRLASLKTEVDLAQNAQGAGQAADAGLAGAASQKLIALQAAQAALADPVATAASRYGRALALLKKLEVIELAPAGSVPDVLSAAEKAQLTALAAAGAAAEPTAATLDTDLVAVYAAQDALGAQILTQIAANVDQLATDASVAAKRAGIVTAQAGFDAALAAFAAANKGDLDQWQAVIPDPAWALLLDYQEGLAALNTLAATDLPALAAAIDAAETDYTTALAAAELAQRRDAARSAAISVRLASLTSASAVIGNRLPSAIRGDTY